MATRNEDYVAQFPLQLSVANGILTETMCDSFQESSLKDGQCVLFVSNLISPFSSCCPRQRYED